MNKTKLLLHFIYNITTFLLTPFFFVQLYPSGNFSPTQFSSFFLFSGGFLYFRSLIDVLHFGHGFPLYQLFPNRLVSQGFYSNNRHPIIWASLIYFLGVLMSYNYSIIDIVFVLALTFTLLSAYSAIIIEAKLLSIHGDSFRKYKESVPFLKWQFHKSSDTQITLVHQIAWLISVVYFSTKYKITVKGLHHIPQNAPFVVVAPHQNYFDPFFFGGIIPHKVHYVTTADVFKSRFLKFALDAIGTIPIRRHVQDLKAIRKMIGLVKKGHSVGIFPEGGRTMDGRPIEIVPETIKLIQRCKAPILPLKIKGAFEIWPRWSSVRRSGKVEIEFQPIIPVENQSGLEELTTLIKSSIFYDDIKYYPTTSKKRAHGLNNLLWSCPECHTNDTIKSDGKTTISCQNCHSRWTVSPELHLIGKHSFTIASWLDTIRSTITPLKLFELDYNFSKDEHPYLLSKISAFLIDDKIKEDENLSLLMTNSYFAVFKENHLLQSFPFEEITYFSKDFHHKLSIAIKGSRYTFALQKSDIQMKWFDHYNTFK